MYLGGVRDDGKVGRPDGMKFDKHGNLFSTGPGGVWVFNPQGDVIGRINLPDKTSNLNWGDDDLQALYITCSTAVYACAARPAAGRWWIKNNALVRHSPVAYGVCLAFCLINDPYPPGITAQREIVLTVTHPPRGQANV